MKYPKNEEAAEYWMNIIKAIMNGVLNPKRLRQDHKDAIAGCVALEMFCRIAAYTIGLQREDHLGVMQAQDGFEDLVSVLKKTDRKTHNKLKSATIMFSGDCARKYAEKALIESLKLYIAGSTSARFAMDDITFTYDATDDGFMISQEDEQQEAA